MIIDVFQKNFVCTAVLTNASCEGAYELVSLSYQYLDQTHAPSIV